MHIRPASLDDIPTIQALYAEAIAFQRGGGHPSWRALDLGVVEQDIAARSQHAVVLDGQVAGIFSFCPPSAMDREIWDGMAPESARYIHRIIVGRAWKGRQLFAPMLAWCEAEALRLGLGRLRLDTWAESAALIRHYAHFGFRWVGERTTSANDALPPPYRGLRLAIMEKPVGAGRLGRPTEVAMP
ncbi:GNAT family N-acetyltransferase [Rhizobacter sp. SG703]|uniref:GNAT family N-acetyltransferase n=1 Tax=Rhizobacter sp. SG703 TaxID=2587140 RepID=UPI001446BC7F|nr:GNAT family N-acetyltransferase [Rhizobacter sp. SG703]NKI95764.1 RimJ/RimL family protein N-acetyltransferase [Rhizobacter sp. SG703]